MNLFEKKFLSKLEEDVAEALALDPAADVPAAPVPDEQESMDSTLNSVDDVSDNPGVSWRKDQNNQQRSTIEGWVVKVGEFVEYLNGTEGSIQKQLADADCDTMFNEVSRSETKKITRIAQDLSALEQSLKGYLISNDDE